MSDQQRTPFERVALRLHIDAMTTVAWADAEGGAGVFMRALPDGRVRVIFDPDATTAAGLAPEQVAIKISSALSYEDLAPTIDRRGTVWSVTGTPRPPIPEDLTPKQAATYRLIRKLGHVKSGTTHPLRTLRQLEAKGLIVVRHSSEWSELHPEGGYVGLLREDWEAESAANKAARERQTKEEN